MNYLLLVVAAGVWWVVRKPQAVFVVRDRGGRAEVARGKVAEAFVSAIVEVCCESGLTSGEARRAGGAAGVAVPGRTPPGVRQRLRNC